jgi:hypothetical protein
MMDDLNAQVAEKVMGWVYVPSFIGNAVTMAPPSWSQGDNVYIETAKWNPSTSIADAWLVVEEMRRRGWQVDVVTDDPGWSCWLHRLGGKLGKPQHYVSADTAPEAICRAALEAYDFIHWLTPGGSQYPR